MMSTEGKLTQFGSRNRAGMRIHVALHAAMVIGLALFISACGGGGGGNPGVGSNPPTLGSFTKRVALQGSISSSTGDDLTFASAATFRHSQILVRSTDLNASGNIVAITFEHTNALTSAITCPHMTIKLGHSSNNNLSTDMSSGANTENGKGSLQTVLEDTTVTIPAAASYSKFTIKLTTPFEANGTDNLVIDLTRNAACSGDVVLQGHPSSDSHVAYATSTDTLHTDSATSTATHTADMWIDFEGGDNLLLYPNTFSLSGPFTTAATLEHYQLLYRANDINGSGLITGIAFLPSTTTTESNYKINVRLAHTTKSTLSNTFLDNYTDAPPTLVASNVNFHVPGGVPAGTPIWLPISMGYDYNGTNNLIVDIEVLVTPDATNLWRGDNVSGIASSVRGTVGSPTGTVTQDWLQTIFRFNGGPIDIITDESLPDSTILNSGSNGRLTLYRASELGSAGTITSIACRLDSQSIADNYANYQVIIGHSGVDPLQTSKSNDFLDQTIAVDGTITVPAGLKAGDWLKIPLTHPFHYNGKDNLAIWMGTLNTSGASSSQACLKSAIDSTRYGGQIGVGIPGADTIMVYDNKFDMKLNIVQESTQ